MANLTPREQWECVREILESQGWAILRDAAGQELQCLGAELRAFLDERTAGRMDGVEWAFTALPNRIRDAAAAEEEKAKEGDHAEGGETQAGGEVPGGA